MIIITDLITDLGIFDIDKIGLCYLVKFVFIALHSKNLILFICIVLYEILHFRRKAIFCDFA